jgi:hypothetical protein
MMTPNMAPLQVVLARKHDVLTREFREHPFECSIAVERRCRASSRG